MSWQKGLKDDIKATKLAEAYLGCVKENPVNVGGLSEVMSRKSGSQYNGNEVGFINKIHKNHGIKFEGTFDVNDEVSEVYVWFWRDKYIFLFSDATDCNRKPKEKELKKSDAAVVLMVIPRY